MIKAFGKQWNTTMEGGRRVHPNHPNTVFTDDMVVQNNDGTISLLTEKADTPITTKHWDGNWYVSNTNAAQCIPQMRIRMACSQSNAYYQKGVFSTQRSG